MFLQRFWGLARVGLLIGAVIGAGKAIAATDLDPIAPRLHSADPARGARVFLQCKICHVIEKGAASTVGPNLWGIVGRPIATAPNFAYTDGLQALDDIWDYESLNRYLFDPQAMAPETRMVFPGVKPAQERADLIAYLRTLADEPVALPPPSSRGTEPIYGGLPEGKGREAVYFTCRACHALEQFTDRNLSRAAWEDLLGEMVADNGMAAPEPWAQRLMLDYLQANFGPKQDWSGLPAGPGREEVYYTCKSCHSLMLVTQQGMSRERWDETLEWMVEDQGMNEIDDVLTRNLILDYLSTHFGSG